MAMTLGQMVEVHKHDQAFLRAFVRVKRLMEEKETLDKLKSIGDWVAIFE